MRDTPTKILKEYNKNGMLSENRKIDFKHCVYCTLYYTIDRQYSILNYTHI